MKKRKRKLKETELQSRVATWVKSSEFDRVFRDGHGFGFETKVAEGETFPFSSLPEGEEIALLRGAGVLEKWYGLRGAKFEKLYHKISDQSQGKKPFDFFVLRNAPCYLVIGYYGGYEVVAIEVDEWMQYKKRKGGRGSLSYDDALRWGVELWGS